MILQAAAAHEAASEKEARRAARRVARQQARRERSLASRAQAQQAG
eukprot:COSAG01_NODE_20250_length_963_cov_20.501157_2_plen_45_part_01